MAVKTTQDKAIDEGIKVVREAIKKLETLRENYQNVIDNKNPDNVSFDEQEQDARVVTHFDGYIFDLSETIGYEVDIRA